MPNSRNCSLTRAISSAVSFPPYLFMLCRRLSLFELLFKDEVDISESKLSLSLLSSGAISNATLASSSFVSEPGHAIRAFLLLRSTISVPFVQVLGPSDIAVLLSVSSPETEETGVSLLGKSVTKKRGLHFEDEPEHRDKSSFWFLHNPILPTFFPGGGTPHFISYWADSFSTPSRIVSSSPSALILVSHSSFSLCCNTLSR
mmetsp:Transcript_6306/g.10867  ORF Transcript_6306/g.10867 Transcript_6306/m.10867 type:complete len:202 (+) Transcript_6306:539-1144(+)